MKKVLYVHPNESIAYLIDRIENTEGDTIYLVADASPVIFTDFVNVKLLKREATNLGRHIIIVSQNKAILGTVRNAGFEVLAMSAADLERQEKGQVKKNSFSESEDESFKEHDLAKQDMVSSQDTETISSRGIFSGASLREKIQQDNFFFKPKKVVPMESVENNQMHKLPTEKSLSWKFITISFLIAVGIAVFGFYALLPKLSVSIVPKKETLHFDFQVTADSKLPTVDLDDSNIPGQIIKIEKEVSDNFTATGKQNEGAKAQGEITIYNEFSSSPQVLVNNTRFKSSDGKIFRITKRITIPGATVEGGKVTSPGVITAAVVADQPGEDYNIPPSDFSIPGFEGTSKFTGFYGKSSEIMSGGASGDSFFATKEDLEKAEAALQEQFKQREEEYITEGVPKGLVVLGGSGIDSSSEFSVEPVESDATFKAVLTTTYDIFVFAESDVAALAERHLSKRLLDTEKAVPGTRVISYANEILGGGKTSLDFTVKVNELVIGALDEQGIKDALSGKNEVEIKEALSSNEAIESAEVTFWPFWISLAPENPKRIKVTLDES